MRFSFEVPIKYAEQLDDVQDYLFVLGQDLDNRDYFNYIKRSDKFKIVDNGANEGQHVPPEELIKLSKKLNADMIVIPDLQFNYSVSMSMYTHFHNIVKRIAPEIKLMGVPQGNDYNLHRRMTRAMDRTVDLIGIPYKLILRYGYGIIPKTQTPLHMLGFPDREVGKYMNTNFQSMDTGAPFNAAYRGLKLYDVPKRVKGIDTNSPSIIMTPEIEELFRYNVSTLKKTVMSQMIPPTPSVIE